MPTYRVQYKSYYREHSEFGHEDVESQSEDDALEAFYKGRIFEIEHLEVYRGGRPDSVSEIEPRFVESWWEGDWLLTYRGIEETDMVRCPVCHGLGEVARDTAAGLSLR